MTSESARARTLRLAVLVAAAGLPSERAGGSSVDYWTPERVASAIPRDLVLDERGLGYLRRPDGTLAPYGHPTPATTPTVRAVPGPASRPEATNNGRGGGGGGGGGIADTEGPIVTDFNPDAGAAIGASHTFSAKVTDTSGVKSVSFVITYPDGRTQSFSPSRSGEVWSVALQGFTDGAWTWHVVAKDGAARGGNMTTTQPIGFTVETVSEPPTGDLPGEDPPPAGEPVTNAAWSGGVVQTAVGRLLHEMPANKAHSRWNAYVCSGTVVTDETEGRSIVLTAAHCVYDDANKAFARNVIFIPNQAGTTGTGTDWNCGNDPLGCWTASHGVVDVSWTDRTWPANIPWDYAYTS